MQESLSGLDCVTVRLETSPGEQAQVDFGQVTLNLGETRKRVWAFVMTLSYSRHRFVRFVERQDVQTWLDCHIRAFEFFGGATRTVVLDNLKAGVVKADLYDPTLNRAYQELERHYGFVDPAKVRTPEHKGKVKRSMPTVRHSLSQDGSIRIWPTPTKKLVPGQSRTPGKAGGLNCEPLKAV